MALPRRKLLFCARGVIAAAVLLLASCSRSQDNSRAKVEAPAEIALPQGVSRDQYDQVAQSLTKQEQRTPHRFDILFAIARDPQAAWGYETVAACLAEIPSEHEKYGQAARLYQGQALVALFHARQGERNLREYIRLTQAAQQANPEHLAIALDLLRYILEIELRFDERHGVLQAIHLLGANETFETMAYCFPNLLRWNGPQAVEWIENFWKQNPDDFRIRVALGRYRMGQGKLAEAREILNKCCEEHPEDLRAQAALLSCYYEENDWAEMEKILDRLPPRAAKDPWLLLRLRGHVSNHRQQYDEAIAAFRQSLQADQTNTESHLGLAKAYGGLGRGAERAAILEKLKVLTRIQNRLGWVLFHPRETEPLMEIAEMSREIEFNQQAALVAQLVLKIDPQHARAKALLGELEARKKTLLKTPQATTHDAITDHANN